MRYLILFAPILLLSACATPISPLVREGHHADYITIDKSDRLLTLWEHGQPLKTYAILGMGDPFGPKMQEGDNKTPEGHYEINEKHPSENFQKFLNISYPNEEDTQRARLMGIPAGGHVGIHGDRGGWSGYKERRNPNWTNGCMSVDNDSIEEIYGLVDVGTEIFIEP